MTTLLEAYTTGLDQLAEALAAVTRRVRARGRRSPARPPLRRARRRPVRRQRQARTTTPPPPAASPRFAGRGTCPRCSSPRVGLVTSPEGLLCRDCHPDLPEAS